MAQLEIILPSAGVTKTHQVLRTAGHTKLLDCSLGQALIASRGAAPSTSESICLS
jgi:hypothetical protein